MLNRRSFIKKTGILTPGLLLFTKAGIGKHLFSMNNTDAIRKIKPLNSRWETQDPFIFCAYHYDLYPGGNENLGPASSLEGRNIGQDFAGKDGWNMYHGSKVPGFPAHPHCGFETVTIVTKGMVDHSDSLGALGRFGEGDVQWLTSGKGVQHAEMFPLLKKDANHLELFQIWLNLPTKSKKVEPHYKMLWREDIPNIEVKDKQDRQTSIRLIAGTYEDRTALSPTPDSWAADPNNHVQIWTFKMAADAEFSIPPIMSEVKRSLYFYRGESCSIGDTQINENHLIELDPEKEVLLNNGSTEGYFLFLQGRPIDEPLVQYGPFVTNTDEELQDVMKEYRRTQFGGWPWAASDPVHDISLGRFSRLPDGREVIK